MSNCLEYTAEPLSLSFVLDSALPWQWKKVAEEPWKQQSNQIPKLTLF